MSNKMQQGSKSEALETELEAYKEHVNAQITKLQGSMDAQAEFQRSLLEELRQIRVVRPELKFPVFRSSSYDHPLDWLSKAERFFNFYKVPEDQKFAIASFHLQGQEALEWLILYERSTVPSSSSWAYFVEQFLTHFGYGDIEGALSRLKQEVREGKEGRDGKQGVNDYIIDFLRLVSIASKKKWTDNQLKGFFINGLQEVLRGDVLLYNPETLSEAVELARADKQPRVFCMGGQQLIIPDLPLYQAVFMGKTRVKLVISTGSTHNFISSYVLQGAEYRRLIIKEDDPLVVESVCRIGDTITTEGRIDGARVNLQGFKFAADFYLLPDLPDLPNLRECHMILGNGWQCSLDGYTVGDSLTFNGTNYQLTAEKHPPRTIIQPFMSLRATRRKVGRVL